MDIVHPKATSVFTRLVQYSRRPWSNKWSLVEWGVEMGMVSSRDWQMYSLKGQTVNILDFAGHVVSVVTTRSRFSLVQKQF